MLWGVLYSEVALLSTAKGPLLEARGPWYQPWTLGWRARKLYAATVISESEREEQGLEFCNPHCI